MSGRGPRVPQSGEQVGIAWQARIMSAVPPNVHSWALHESPLSHSPVDVQSWNDRWLWLEHAEGATQAAVAELSELGVRQQVCPVWQLAAERHAIERAGHPASPVQAPPSPGPASAA